MKLVTFNIRCDFNQDKENCFCFRAPYIMKKIEKEKPDLICFQEVLPHVAGWLKKELTDYYVIGCGRSEDLRDEQVAVAYRKDKLNLIQMETYWLSPTPYVPASRYEQQSSCPRVCTESVFELLDEKKVFRITNIHLDHIGKNPRKLGLIQVMEKMEHPHSFCDIPVILAGDFNGEPDSEELAVMKNYPKYVNYTENIGITYHGFTPEDEPESIDYIFGKNIRNCSKAEKWEDREGEVWLSDHYPICVEMEF